uniref:Uncharacterized protein n=1 Tax=Anoplophora glabripennis TaxID=217634 RepID=V5I7W0_ANOGL
MADWRINEKYRKPRKAKGTPFYVQRNYYAFGVILGSAALWYLYELWPVSRKIKQDQIDKEKFKIPEGLEIRVKHMQIGKLSGPTDELLAKAREREADKYDEDKSKPQSWLSRVFSSQPDI